MYLSRPTFPFVPTPMKKRIPFTMILQKNGMIKKVYTVYTICFYAR